DRQRIVLFLGDGRSLAGPLDEDTRAALCDDMVKRGVTFFSVPLGARLEPLNLHGLANGTGGKCVRLTAPEEPKNDKDAKPEGTRPLQAPLEMAVDRLLEAFSVPVLYPDTFKLPAEVVEAFPPRLPPLRSDSPTLVVGKIKPGATLNYTLAGTVAGKEVK